MDVNSALQQATGKTGGVGDALQQEKAELGPMNANAQATAAQPTPPPELEKAPKSPEMDLSQGATEWVGLLNIVSALGGAKSRQGGTAALQAFASGMDGFKKGKFDEFDKAQEQWKTANQSVIENNKAQVDEYKSVLQDKKLSVDEQMAEIKAVASQYHNDIMSQLAEARNFTAVARVMDMMESNGDKMQIQIDKLQQGLDKINDKTKEILDATNAYKNLYNDGTGKIMKNAPPFTQWLKTDWNQMKQGEGEQPSAPSSMPGSPADSAPATPAAPGAASGGVVNVVAPDGTPGTIPAAKLNAALKAGYTKAQ